jgi:hypothetical protein
VQRRGQSESSITVAVDDGSITRRYENSIGAGDILDEWWQMLDPDSNAGSASIRPYFEPDSVRWAVSTPPTCDTGWESL